MSARGAIGALMAALLGKADHRRPVGRISSAEGGYVCRDESKHEPRSRLVESKVGKPR